jgi:hypothetical protein
MRHTGESGVSFNLQFSSGRVAAVNLVRTE